MTFSVAARCPDTGQVGVAVSSSSICVASRCAYVRAGVGAALSQNITDPTLGPAVLDAIAGGADATSALQQIAEGNNTIEWRQVVVQPLNGESGVRNGSQVLGDHAEAQGRDCIAAGNMLASTDVPAAMVAAFDASTGHLAERLLVAMEAGLKAGGEAGPVHSAGILVADRESWPVVDLRVDYTEECPIAALRDLWLRYEPQLDDYVLRAHQPDAAPSYGVAGDP